MLNFRDSIRHTQAVIPAEAGIQNTVNSNVIHSGKKFFPKKRVDNLA